MSASFFGTRIFACQKSWTSALERESVGDGGELLTFGHPSARIRNVHWKAGMKSLCLCNFLLVKQQTWRYTEGCLWMPLLNWLQLLLRPLFIFSQSPHSVCRFYKHSDQVLKGGLLFPEARLQDWGRIARTLSRCVQGPFSDPLVKHVSGGGFFSQNFMPILVLEVLQYIWHSDKENPSAYWHVALSCPLDGLELYKFVSRSDLVLDADHSLDILGIQEA